MRIPSWPFPWSLIFSFPPVPIPPPGGHNLSINLTGPGIASAENFKFQSIITNHGHEDVAILNHPASMLTPEWHTNIFGMLALDRKHAEFKGVYIKWSPKIALETRDVTILGAGKSITIEQDLSGVYNFTQSGAGWYNIDTASWLHMVSSTGKVSPYKPTVSQYHVKVSGNLSTPYHPYPIGHSKPGARFHGCSLRQMYQIDEAIPFADKYIANAVAYLRTRDKPTTRFETWFGRWDESHDAVLRNFNALVGGPKNVTYDCSTCSYTPMRNEYAYISPIQPGHVNLCKLFWSAPLKGTDSKAGILARELVHFDTGRQVRDVLYGHEGARDLARIDPYLAVIGPDNNEYFLENNPQLL